MRRQTLKWGLCGAPEGHTYIAQRPKASERWGDLPKGGRTAGRPRGGRHQSGGKVGGVLKRAGAEGRGALKLQWELKGKVVWGQVFVYVTGLSSP